MVCKNVNWIGGFGYEPLARAFDEWCEFCCIAFLLVQHHCTRVVPKVMSNNFLHANWEQQTKESTVVDGTSCCVILECLVTSIACIT